MPWSIRLTSSLSSRCSKGGAYVSTTTLGTARHEGLLRGCSCAVSVHARAEGLKNLSYGTIIRCSWKSCGSPCHGSLSGPASAALNNTGPKQPPRSFGGEKRGPYWKAVGTRQARLNSGDRGKRRLSRGKNRSAQCKGAGEKQPLLPGN